MHGLLQITHQQQQQAAKASGKKKQRQQQQQHQQHTIQWAGHEYKRPWHFCHYCWLSSQIKQSKLLPMAGFNKFDPKTSALGCYCIKDSKHGFRWLLPVVERFLFLVKCVLPLVAVDLVVVIHINAIKDGSP